jgi:Protein of Unknown function (DUF2784)
MPNQTLADLVLLLHAGYILFVVLGLLLILVGGALNWQWVRNRWFRLTHLAAIVLVVAQAWLGITCPLTTLENTLRTRAGQSSYELGFIADRVQPLIFFQADWWVFAIAYTAFALLVLLSLWMVRPRFRHTRPTHRTNTP